MVAKPTPNAIYIAYLTSHRSGRRVDLPRICEIYWSCIVAELNADPCRRHAFTELRLEAKLIAAALLAKEA